jgi:hypothetical protein
VVVVDIFVTSCGRYPFPSVAVGAASCRPFLSWAKVSHVRIGQLDLPNCLNRLDLPTKKFHPSSVL